MKHFKMLFLISILMLGPVASLQAAGLPLMLAASGGSITILSPADGAVLGSGSGNELNYKVTLSPNGNHLHVYIDDRRPIIVRKVSGCPCTLDLPDLAPGKHAIVVSEATAGHSLTGLKAGVSVTVK
jgi:hypothetical protein